MDVTKFGVAAAMMLAAGCAAPTLAPAPAPHGETVATPVPPLTIVLSDLQAPFVSVAAELAKLWPGPVDMYRLTAEPAVDRATHARVQAGKDKLVAAIGLPAAQWARSLRGKQVVFSQVFHYREAALITPWMKGVSAVPALHDQFAAWKRLDPELDRVGVITGKGLDDVLAQARTAARAQGIRLSHFYATSDVDTLRSYQRYPHMHAWWILPDNRVLSRDVIREMLAGAKSDKQLFMVNVAAAPGTLLNAYVDYRDVAELMSARLRAAARSRHGVPGPDVVPLRKARVAVNSALAEEFGLIEPAKSHAP